MRNNSCKSKMKIVTWKTLLGHGWRVELRNLRIMVDFILVGNIHYQYINTRVLHNSHIHNLILIKPWLIISSNEKPTFTRDSLTSTADLSSSIILQSQNFQSYKADMQPALMIFVKCCEVIYTERESVLYHGIKTPSRPSFLTTSRCFETVVKNYFEFFI